MEPPACVLKSRYFNRDTYKTLECMSWIITGTCRYREKCLYAHGKEELRNKVTLSSPPPPQICLPVARAMPSPTLPVPYRLMPPLPPGPPPQVYESISPKPLGNSPPLAPLPPQLLLAPLPPLSPSPTILQLAPISLSDWASLVKTVESLHDQITLKKDDSWCFEETCIVCLSNVLTHTFMPCKHIVVCQDCASEYDKKEVKKNGCYMCHQRAELVPIVSC
uniref:Uncharacterized protein n=1 Tax=viral metagenome TaxID=1070528 RepID=A0A6C0J250_9ZZZZ